jgi:hypothetical protein
MKPHFAALLLLLAACARTEAPVADKQIWASMCEPGSGQLPPQPGERVQGCQDSLRFIVTGVSADADRDFYMVRIKVKAEDQPKLATWMKRHLRSGVSFAVDGRVVANLFVTDNVSRSIDLIADTAEEADQLMRSVDASASMAH